MDTEQLNQLNTSLNRIAAATLAASVIASMNRKPTLKEVQDAFKDCYMVVNPAVGTTQQDAFQERLDKREW